MNATTLRIIITSSALIVATAHQFIPGFKLDMQSLALLIVALIPWLAPLFKSMEIPGLGKVEFQELRDVQKNAAESGLIVQDKLCNDTPTYSFQEIADRDPNLAMAGLRIEIDKRIKALMVAGVKELAALPTRRSLHHLHEAMILTSEQVETLDKLLQILNRAVHGEEVPAAAYEWVMSIGPKLLQSLDDKLKRFTDNK